MTDLPADQDVAGDASIVPPIERPERMEMTIQAGMLKTLGINLYTSIAKVLVEFVANAYDSDAAKIEITLPFERIAAERKALREKLKKRHGEITTGDESEREQAKHAIKFEALSQTLPDEVEITLKDNGHGMTYQEVEKKFLPLNRSRRLDDDNKETALKSEGGRRFVMGRKGLGKLAAFGAAQRVTVRTKRAGETYATTITMDDSDLNKIQDISKVPIPVSYEDGLDASEHGTVVTFSRLKSDALKDSIETITRSITRSFYAIKPEDFSIYLNDQLVRPDLPAFEFLYPLEMTLERVRSDDLAEDAFVVEELGPMSFKYFVGFRARNEHLAAKERGVRIYCNKRLAAGPTLLGLGTGMHSFHSQDYMECVVEADDLDRGSSDLISTSRTQFREGNDLIDGLSSRITELMTKAIAAHAKFREQQAKEELEKDPSAAMLSKIVSNLPKKTQVPARKLLTSIAAEHGVGTKHFEELAPIVLATVNAGEVLIKLIELGSNPQTISQIAGELRELAELEKADALKLYRGRRSGIQALIKLFEKGEELWNKKQTEAELHLLLKQNPWLIKPEISSYLSSDVDLNKVVSRIAKSLGVDKFAPIINDGGTDDQTRPDLVFVMSDPTQQGPHVINVVELKSVSKALTIEHWQQLEKYIFKIEEWCSTELGYTPTIHGYLIGAMPDVNAAATGQKMLLKKLNESTPNERIKIVGIHMLIEQARAVHLEAIKAMEEESGDDEA